MIPKVLGSLRHPTVKHFLRLQQDAAYRRQAGSTVIDGRQLVRELSAHDAIRIKHLLCVEGEEGVPPAAQTSVVTRDVMAEIAQCKGLRLLAEAEIPRTGLCFSAARAPHVVALVGLRYPGNIGNIVRTAHGLGWDGALLCGGAPDVHCAKMVRASRGACLMLPLEVGAWPELRSLVARMRVASGAPPNVVVADRAPNSVPLPQYIEARRQSGRAVHPSPHGAALHSSGARSAAHRAPDAACDGEFPANADHIVIPEPDPDSSPSPSRGPSPSPSPGRSPKGERWTQCRRSAELAARAKHASV